MNLQIQSAEVIEIDYTDTLPDRLYSIKAKILHSFNTPIIARPLDSNLKKLPLKGEVVLIITALAAEFSANKTSSEYYYTDVVNLHSSTHHNALPKATFTERSSAASGDANSYQEASTGVPNTTKAPEKEELGKSFSENKDIKPLQLFEGDYLLEGRFGNSIRFGSTITRGLNQYSKKPFWQKGKGKDGDPITIIRNGQIKNVPKEYNKFITENINEDQSSIYLTSTQEIPLKQTSDVMDAIKNQEIDSFLKSPKFSGKQIIFDSGRIVFNAKETEIVFLSKNGIGFSSPKSIAFDTKKNFEINASKIFLGLKAKEPLLLGDTKKDWLKDLISAIEAIIDGISKMTVATPVGPSSPPINVAEFIGVRASQLATLKSKIPTLVSKQNFTL